MRNINGLILIRKCINKNRAFFYELRTGKEFFIDNTDSVVLKHQNYFITFV